MNGRKPATTLLVIEDVPIDVLRADPVTIGSVHATPAYA